jgi:hypothetical protein
MMSQEVVLFKGTHEALRANPPYANTIIVLLVGQAMMVLYLGGTHDGILCSKTFLHTFTLSYHKQPQFTFNFEKRF